MTRICQGIDIVDISKFLKVFFNHKEFISDIFTEKERNYYLRKQQPVLHFARCFAVKEASLKALGIGFSGIGIGHVFQEIEVLPNTSGKTRISFAGWTAKICKKRRVNQVSFSISHTSRQAIAYVLLAGNQN